MRYSVCERYGSGISDGSGFSAGAGDSEGGPGASKFAGGSDVAGGPGASKVAGGSDGGAGVSDGAGDGLEVSGVAGVSNGLSTSGAASPVPHPNIIGTAIAAAINVACLREIFFDFNNESSPVSGQVPLEFETRLDAEDVVFAFAFDCEADVVIEVVLQTVAI